MTNLPQFWHHYIVLNAMGRPSPSSLLSCEGPAPQAQVLALAFMVGPSQLGRPLGGGLPLCVTYFWPHFHLKSPPIPFILGQN